MPIDKEVLREIPLFAELEERGLRELASSLKEKTYEPGEVVVEEGKHGVGFFVVLEGGAEVTIAGERRGEIGPGDYFGELALLDDAAGRLATVTASTPLRCAAISAWQFKPFLRTQPEIAWSMMKVMARRLADAERHHAAS